MMDTSNSIETAPRAAPSVSDTEQAHGKSAAAKQRGLEPPDILRSLSDEERTAFEKKLRRKIDLRILPMIIIMYILNYIDRYVFLYVTDGPCPALTVSQETTSLLRASQVSRRI